VATGRLLPSTLSRKNKGAEKNQGGSEGKKREGRALQHNQKKEKVTSLPKLNKEHTRGGCVAAVVRKQATQI